jgi:glycerol-3-phosphate acyltransferase PlsY
VSTFVATLIALIPFYLIGTFPSGYLLAKLRGVDITKQGSGNVGATNVARSLGKKAGILTLVLDLTKGLLAIYLASLLADQGWFVAAAAVAVVCGHCFSIPPLLKGGKGVATGLGVLIALAPGAGVTSVVIFVVLFSATRFVSLSSIVATLSAPIYSLVTNQPEAKSLALMAIALVIVYRHRENIQRLIEGRETKFRASRK